MTKEKLAELARLAEAATPGPWTALFVFGSSDLPISICRETGRTINIAGVECPDDEYICEVHPEALNPSPDFRFIAAANPEAVLGLIARIEKLEAALQFYADIGTYGTAGPGDCTSVDSSDCEPVLIDGWGESYRPGKRAREALRGES